MANNDLISRSALLDEYELVHIALTGMDVIMEISAVFEKGDKE